MRPNERCPACRVPALRRRRQSVASQDIADRLIAHTMPEISQRSGDPVITPISVLPGNANDQLLNRSADPRPAKASTGRRALELAGHKLAGPGQDGRPNLLIHHPGDEGQDAPPIDWSSTPADSPFDDRRES